MDSSTEFRSERITYSPCGHGSGNNGQYRSDQIGVPNHCPVSAATP
jgi:hypothetical protein